MSQALALSVTNFHWGILESFGAQRQLKLQLPLCFLQVARYGNGRPIFCVRTAAFFMAFLVLRILRS